MRRTAVLAASIAAVCLGAYVARAESPSLQRHYREGEMLHYVMDARNTDGGQTTTYRAEADGMMQRNQAGVFVTPFAWSHLSFGGSAFPLSPASLGFRQELSLDPAFRLGISDLSKVQPALIGPMLDLMTFYADTQLAMRQDQLQKAGDHVYVKHGTPNSWADHVHYSLAEDSIDFDLTLTGHDPQTGAVTLEVKHVPPAMPQIHLPANWMRTPVSDTANNWVQVKNAGAGKYVASVGKEVFTDEIRLNGDGAIVSATMENPVEVMERDCSDAALLHCGAARRYEIERHIELRRQ